MDLMGETRREQERYDRQARWYDVAVAPMEALAFLGLRRRLWSAVDGSRRVLEIGVGTGRNLAHYPTASRTVALDLSPEMLKRAARKATRAGRSVDLLLADTRHLPFKNGVFDTVLATLVFCSVPDPVRGLAEAGRAVRPDGQVVLLEHVRADNGLLGMAMDALNRLTARGGEYVNRDTAANVRKAGLEITREEKHRMGIVKLLQARPCAEAAAKGENDVVAS
ncbi:MAG: class I SAM-dependent methyltransferase [Dehalococcoidia bacterium]|nr:class I SAM-dependent methyltransferase [Dehalococcoidia bacterium]